MPTLIQAEKERERRHKEISIVGKAHFLDKACKIIRKRSMYSVKKAGIRKVIELITDEEPVIRWTTRVAIWTTSLIPDSVKTKVQETSKRAFEKAANIVNKNIERFTHTSFGSKVVDVMSNKVAPIIERGVEKVVTACSKVKQKTKSLWTKVKSFFA